MKNLFIIFLISHLIIQVKNNDSNIENDLENLSFCNSTLLQIYGFEGKTNLTKYQSIKEGLSNNYCPNIQDSCCSKNDFEKANYEWRQKSETLKRYINNVFLAIQKISLLQTSILIFAGEISSKNTDRCKSIDFTYFNSPLDLNSLYPYIEHGLESFTFLQKGFYCMLCDGKNHSLIGFNDKPIIQISNEMCNDLVFYFREFIIYKINYVDPLIINLNKIFNCIDDADTYLEDYPYNVSLKNINDCLNKGENCEYMCKEFSFGSANNLFLGKLATYLQTIDKLKRISENGGNSSEIRSEDNENIDVDNLDDRFFLVKEGRKSNFLISNMEIVIQDEGINLFNISRNSNFNLESEFNEDSSLDGFENSIKLNKDEANNTIVEAAKNIDFNKDNSKIFENEKNTEISEVIKDDSENSIEEKIVNDKIVEEENFENKFDQENHVIDRVPDEVEMEKLKEEMIIEENEEDQKLKQLANDIPNNEHQQVKNNNSIDNFFSFVNISGVLFGTFTILLFY